MNGVLDFFFVDIMRCGIQGSAVASLIVQLLTVLVQMFYFISRKTGIGFRKFSFDRGINKIMILNGSSEFILVCTYEKDDKNPELLIYKKR